MDDIIKLSIDKVYNSDEVIDKELSGFEVINELLFRFSNAVNNCYHGTGSHYDKLILKLFDSELDYKNDKLYNRMMAVCSLVASYSDSNAILIYRKIKGLEF
jgi:dGTPase